LPIARADIVVRQLVAPSLVRRVSVALPARRYRPPAADAMADALQLAARELADRTPSYE
jgi:hypothetical protein